MSSRAQCWNFTRVGEGSWVRGSTAEDEEVWAHLTQTWWPSYKISQQNPDSSFSSKYGAVCVAPRNARALPSPSPRSLCRAFLTLSGLLTNDL